ncbi:MAG: hypothetical protein K2G47_02170 [Muribaculum sp.]|nr:hypothetical protein [Muribaculum sp.]
MRYHEVIDTQNKLREAINATKGAENKSGNINSARHLLLRTLIDLLYLGSF